MNFGITKYITIKKKNSKVFKFKIDVDGRLMFYDLSSSEVADAA